MTLQDCIERVKAALDGIEAAKQYWMAGESNPSITTYDRQRRKDHMLTHQSEFGWQTANVREILAAYDAARKHVQEAYDNLESIRPQLMAMLEDDVYVMRTVREIHEALKVALGVERG